MSWLRTLLPPVLDADARARIMSAHVAGDDILQAVRLIREAATSVQRRQAMRQEWKEAA